MRSRYATRCGFVRIEKRRFSVRGAVVAIRDDKETVDYSICGFLGAARFFFLIPVPWTAAFVRALS